MIHIVYLSKTINKLSVKVSENNLLTLLSNCHKNSVCVPIWGEISCQEVLVVLLISCVV